VKGSERSVKNPFKNQKTIRVIRKIRGAKIGKTIRIMLSKI